MQTGFFMAMQGTAFKDAIVFNSINPVTGAFTDLFEGRCHIDEHADI
jgi:hypothetical protein